MNDGRSSPGVGRGAGLTNETPFTQAVGETWTRYWFTPADPRPLAIVRILAGGLALMLWLSYAADLQAWFGPAGIVSPDLLDQWRSGWAASLFDFAVAPAVLTALYAAGAVVLALLTVGLATPVVSILAAIFFSSLLHRGPMLAGPADDVVAVILWCLAIGRSGDAFAIDSLLAARSGGLSGGRALALSVRTRVALGLLQVHASVIAAAAALAQLKGDVWWDGTAVWWLAARSDSRLVDLTGLFIRSEYLTNLVTHAIPLFEITFAIGLWFVPLRRVLVPVSCVAWPLIGVLAGEPSWGLAMGVLAVAFVRRG